MRTPRSELLGAVKSGESAGTDKARAKFDGISLYDSYSAYVLEMADMLSIGIVQQFPDRFR